MSRTSSWNELGVPAAALGLAMALVLGLAGCAGETAGTSSYKNPVTTVDEGAIVSAQTLIRWADEGKINAPFGTADRVVVVSVTTQATFVAKRHIPDAVVLPPAEFSMTREEGLGPSPNLMISGPVIDTLVQRLGIDGRTTVVLTLPKASSDSEMYQVSVLYWTLRYWGFSRDRVKILNGGDDAWEVAGQPLTDAVVAVPASTYKVSANQALKDVVRYSVGEMLTMVDAVNRDRTVLNTWQLLDVRGFATSPYLANTYRGNGGMQFLTSRVNGEATRNRLYPSRDALVAAMATSPVMDGSTPVFLSPGKKMLVMCGSSVSASPTFVLFDAVLGVPEGDVIMYDGSSSQWNNYSSARILQAGATAGQAATWAFDGVTPGTTAPRSIGTLPAAVPGEILFIPGSFAYLPSQPEANQVETADKQHMAGGGGSPATPAPGGGGGSGC
jgi:3-mercaptopyruvate sulfurtransferase SseA